MFTMTKVLKNIHFTNSFIPLLYRLKEIKGVFIKYS